MQSVNVLEAKTNFSKLLLLLEKKQESEIVICKSNKPVARLTLIPEADSSSRIGVAKGKFTVPDDFDETDEEIAAMFYGSASGDAF